MALKLRIFNRGNRMADRDHTLDVRKYEGDVTNYQLVTIAHANTDHEEIRVMSPLAVMTREQALVHAAWIVAMVDESENYAEFRAALKAVLNT